MKTENVIVEKSKAFALRIIKMYQYLTSEKNEYILSKQVLKSGTSIMKEIIKNEIIEREEKELRCRYDRDWTY